MHGSVKRFGRVTKRDSPDFLISKESEPNTFQKASFLHELRAIDDVDARGKGLELANNLTKRHEKEVKRGKKCSVLRQKMRTFAAIYQ